jgi:Response regulator containing CheY-like receiver domain and AraC-type DNA-binding domain
MENVSLFNEIVLRSETFLIIVYIIIAYYAFRLSSINSEDGIINRELLQMVALSFLSIAVLLMGRIILSLPDRSIYETDDKYLLSGMVLQFAIPLLLYTTIKMRRTNEGDVSALWVYVVAGAFVVNILISLISILPVRYYSGPFVLWFMTTAVLLLIFIVCFLFTRRVGRLNSLYTAKKHLFWRNGREMSLFCIVAILTLAIVVVPLYVDIRSEYMADFIFIFNVLNIIIAVNLLSPYLKFENERFRSGFFLSEPIFSEKDKNGELRERLLRYFESEKPYLKSNLVVNEVALYLYSNKTYISRVINDSFNLNFNQFVNKFRVEEAKRLYRENTSLSINRLCVSSGFGSIATFTISFRLFAGLSPAEWCKEYKKNGGNGKKV